MAADLPHSTADVKTHPELVRLADRYGVSTEYRDWHGQDAPVSVRTVVAVLAAFGVPAATDDEIAASLRAAELQPWRRVLPPVVVMRQGERSAVDVHLPSGARATVSVRLEGDDATVAAQGSRAGATQDVDGVAVTRIAFTLPASLPLGWHTVQVRSEDGVLASAPLVVSPSRLSWRQDPGGERAWGIMAQLYSVRSQRSWGVGDFGDLADLAAVGADLGADFVLVNPLHAAQPVPPVEDSPYLPTTRRFVNPLYVRVPDIPEVAYLTEPDRALVAAQETAAKQAAAASELIERQSALAAKIAALRVVFAQPRSLARQRRFEAFKEAEGEGLIGFARWCTLYEHFGGDSWPDWAQDPTSPEVSRLLADRPDRVEFFCWLQWIADEQLAAAQRTASAAGMRTGLITDLAVGVHPSGADTWSLRDVLATGVSVGAPPDAFNQRGQDWSQPPWRPDRLAENAFEPYRDMLRTVLRHCGGLRIDHVMGLFRLWCIPSGCTPDQGTYVRYDHEAMVSILLLEAHRAGALVVGEDLGVVEPWVRDYLAERGVAGTSILWFERDDEGRPRPPESYRELCLATVATHDLPPTAGYLAGEHIRLRDRLGLLTRSLQEEQRVDARDRQLVVDALRERGLVGEDPGTEELVTALHRYLALGPSRLLGVLLTDLVGDRRTQNQPGTSTEYPNWRIPLTDDAGREVRVEELARSERARRLAGALNRAVDADR